MDQELQLRVWLSVRFQCAVAVYVAFEKLLPRSPWFSRAAGVGMIVAGGLVLAHGLTVTAPAPL
jgi:hypothetical protein